MTSNKNSYLYVGNLQTKVTTNEGLNLWFAPSYNLETSKPKLHASASIGRIGYEASVDTSWTVALGVPSALLAGYYHWTSTQAEVQKLKEQLKQQERKAERAEKRAEEADELRVKAEESQLQEATRRHEAEGNVESGTIPVRRVPSEDIINARQSHNLANEDYHVAICGASGTGKSTLINAIRGLENFHEEAAGTGENETTAHRTAYKDTKSTFPGARLILHDLPGSGTPAVPDSNYYNNMNLFMFDCIIAVYKDAGQLRSLIDVLTRSRIHDQTILVVRSRSDECLRNKRKQLSSSGKSHNDDTVKKLYLQESTDYLERQLRLPDGLIAYITGGHKPLVYHVSDEMLLHVAKGGASHDGELDERKLVNELKQLVQGKLGNGSIERGMADENMERRFILCRAQSPPPERLIMRMIKENRQISEFPWSC